LFSVCGFAQTPLTYSNAHANILSYTGITVGNGSYSPIYTSLWRSGLYFGAYPNNTGGSGAQSYSTGNMGAARFAFEEWMDRFVISFSPLAYNSSGDGRFQSNITWDNQFFFDRNGHMGIGMDVCAAYTLNVSGKIAAEEVNVLNPGWCDYVFEKDYQLLSIPDLEAYIYKNKKLPEVPSEAEVEQNGVNLAQMNATLLKKIEELTLYMLQQQKQLDELNKKLEALDN